MKKLFIALLLALPLQAHAAATLFWTCESTTLGSTPDQASYSANDTTAAATGTISISASGAKFGSNGCVTVDANDFYDFDGTSLIDQAQGSFGIWVQFKTSWLASGAIGGINLRNSAGGSGNDLVQLRGDSTDEVELNIRQQGGSSSQLDGMTANLSINTWYFIVGRWHIANDDRRLEVYNSSCSLIQAAEDLATDLSTVGPIDLDAIRLGTAGRTDPMWFDNVIISQSYSEPIENFCNEAVYNPSYSSGPTNGTFTNTTLPFTYTPDQNGTTYAAACTNGQTISTFANLKSGTCSGGAAPGTGTDAATADVSNTVTIGGLTAGMTYDVYIGHESSIGGQSGISSLADRTTTSGGTPPSFSVAPNCSATTDGVSCTYTASATSTAYGVCVSPGDGAPNTTQILAGQNNDSVAALWSGSDANTGTADTIVVTGASKPVRANCHFYLTNAGGDSAIDSSQTNEDRTIRSGFLSVVMASHSSTGLCNLDSYFAPDCADGDIFEYEDDTNESADCNISIETDGDIVFTPVAAGDCDGQRTFEISYQDISSTTSGLFTTPAGVGTFAVDDTICNGNTAPVANAAWEEPRAWTVGSAITALDLSEFFTDADGDLMSYTLSSGTWPDGVEQSGAGDKDVTGTPTTENEAGVALVITATDECGDSATFSFYNDTAADIYVIATWTVPNLDNLAVASAQSAVVAVAPWRLNEPGVSIGGYVCGTGQFFLNVAEQTPAASAEATAYQAISVNIVGAFIPNLVGLTQAQAIAAIEAICP